MPEHRPVLLTEAVEALALRPDARVIDATFGRGGHSRAILAALGPQGRLLAFDRDPTAIAAASSITDPRFAIVHAPFSSMAAAAPAHGFAQVDAILMDLGVSSPQLDTPERGFSFRHDGPLDMRMDPTDGSMSAADWLAQASVQQITEVIRTYGEERFAFPIAQAIAARCTDAREGRAEALGTTRQLADLVAGVLRRRQGRPERGHDPATRTFQALRIHINRELDELETALSQAIELLAPEGRLAVISFHSLEDRIVKRAMRGDAAGVAGREADSRMRRLPVMPAAQPQWPLEPLARVLPSDTESDDNPRARSSILRVARRRPGVAAVNVAPGQHRRVA